MSASVQHASTWRLNTAVVAADDGLAETKSDERIVAENEMWLKDRN